MTEHRVKFNDRIRRRHRKKAVKTYLQGLAELITNSDGSYQDIEKRGEKVSGEIIITIDRIRRTFEIVDKAEGLSKRGMLEIFTQTGAKHKTHKKGGRSLFGKGLPDTLFSPIIEIGSGEVHSIKNGEYALAEFKKNAKSEEVVDIKPNGDRRQEATNFIRKKLCIGGGSGTLVKFKLADGSTFPRDGTIVRDITSFYMLRFINQNPNRKVKIRFTQDGQQIYETLIKYRGQQNKEEMGEKLKTKFKFRDYPPIKISGVLYKTQENLRGYSPTGLDRREGGILIFDECRNVMDLQLFSFDEDPNAKYYIGTLELEGAYEVIRDYMDKEDEEILTDTRDGFDRRHPFYRELKKIVDKWLKKIISRDQLEESRETFLSKETQDKQREAFKQLNELYEKINTDAELLLGEREGDKEGLDFPLEFSIRKAKLIMGKKYKIRLSADTTLIPKKSEVKFAYDSNRISLNPNKVVIKKSETGKIYHEYIEITPLKIGKDVEVIATYSEDIKASLGIDIVEEEYSIPKAGLEFFPKKIIAPPGTVKSLALYVDLKKIEEDEIFITADSKTIHINKTKYTLTHRTKSIKGIGKILIPVKGLKKGAICEVTAACGDINDSVIVEVRDIKKKGGALEIFDGWTYKSLDSKVQAFPNIATKKIDINSNHPINQHILGKTKEDAEINVEVFPHCQLLIGNLILTQFLQKAFFDARENGKLRDPNIDSIRYIEEEKYNIGDKIIQLFVKDSQISFFKSITQI